MPSRADCVDERNYPGTRQADGSFDGGDTAAIIGTIAALVDLQYEGILDLLPMIPMRDGVPIRHPDRTKWYSETDRFSRDQLIPCICAGITHQPYTMRAIYKAHKKRLFLTAWNTKGNGAFDTPNKLPDICGPSVWALWLRYKRPWWSRLVLCLLDLETLAGAINWRFFQPATNRVTRNNMLIVIISRDHQPTIASRLAFAITDWDTQISKWEAHCAAVGEYPTADLFREYLTHR